MFPRRGTAKWFNNARGFGFLARSSVFGEFEPVLSEDENAVRKGERADLDEQREEEAKSDRVLASRKN